MKLPGVIQARTGAPHGNCYAACVATILECGLDDIPDVRWPDGPLAGQNPQPGHRVPLKGVRGD
jgi:hypothetical protein